ncbi:PTS lactose/cellobiose transporter subunit IIA [Thermoanaerobacterium thermosaccharolyticum]|uniref:Phosphotransferase system cellobiose-specific component IIA n=1 Tax=Thermoanaerobacterium thermosaccharolyticum M0795 TaxID=698948 RepID=L0IP32_THETR|nr:PTS lactose/cellobiose transporter subunit IIA [Thermoanaerobacterium thermosaccharolyticum]AGB19976.1 phosphotransferase system cellobiose-specific component IIA [Thermoanaerobacterium thermosaccharolyticum M0795]
MDFEQIIFEIIVHAGNARSDAFEALTSAKNGDFENAYRLLDNAKEELNAAHDIQNKLITEEANGKDMPVKLITIHAEDHLMNAILARDLIEEMISLYKNMLANKLE